MNILAPEAAGFGIGQALYEGIFASLRGEDIHAAVAATTLPNAASCAIPRSLRFRRVGVVTEAGRKFD